MRPQQQNRRMRGRNNNNNSGGNNNNRKGGGNQNPLARSYESNGPDVKIRGNALQIAEKYTTLARDAQSSGDRVMAENYLQHAEHYNRIIAAYQAQMPNQNLQQNRDDFDDEDMEEGEFERQGNGEGQAQTDGSGPQPVIDGVPAEIALNSDNNGNNNSQREQGGREDRREFRNSRRDRNRDGQNGQRRDFQRRDAQPQADAVSDEATTDTLPDFLTGGAQPATEAPAPREEREESAPRRTRRPRRGEPRSESEAEAEAQPVVVETPARAEVLAGSDE